MTSWAATAVPQQNPGIVRVFSEGVPVAATEAEVRRIRNLGGENDSASRQLARYIAEVARTYPTAVKPMLVFRLDRYLRGGDHYSFNQQGYAAVRFTEYREDYNHQHQNVRTENGIAYGDVLKFVNFDYVANVARLNAATLASLASAPAPPGEGSPANQRSGKRLDPDLGGFARQFLLRSPVARYRQPGMGPCPAGWKRNPGHPAHVEG